MWIYSHTHKFMLTNVHTRGYAYVYMNGWPYVLYVHTHMHIPYRYTHICAHICSWTYMRTYPKPVFIRLSILRLDFLTRARGDRVVGCERLVRWQYLTPPCCNTVLAQYCNLRGLLEAVSIYYLHLQYVHWQVHMGLHRFLCLLSFFDLVFLWMFLSSTGCIFREYLGNCLVWNGCVWSFGDLCLFCIPYILKPPVGFLVNICCWFAHKISHWLFF